MLRTRAIETLKDTPAAIALYEFGAHADGQADAWSDIDLQVISEDVNTSVSGRSGPFMAIAPVMLEWEITRTPDAWAATVLFAGKSPFAHLDIGFSAPMSPGNDALLTSSRQSWIQEPGARCDAPEIDWYAPKAGSIEHAIIGDLLSVIRYTKSRRRHHDLQCWKFFSALANRVLEATYRSAVDRSRQTGRTLTSREHTELRHALAAGDTDRLASMLLAGDARGMDKSISQLAHELVRLGTELEDVSAPYSKHTRALLSWIDRALRDPDFNDALS